MIGPNEVEKEVLDIAASICEFLRCDYQFLNKVVRRLQADSDNLAKMEDENKSLRIQLEAAKKVVDCARPYVLLPGKRYDLTSPLGKGIVDYDDVECKK